MLLDLVEQMCRLCLFGGIFLGLLCSLLFVGKQTGHTQLESGNHILNGRAGSRNHNGGNGLGHAVLLNLLDGISGKVFHTGTLIHVRGNGLAGRVTPRGTVEVGQEVWRELGRVANDADADASAGNMTLGAVEAVGHAEQVLGTLRSIVEGVERQVLGAGLGHQAPGGGGFHLEGVGLGLVQAGNFEVQWFGDAKGRLLQRSDTIRIESPVERVVLTGKFIRNTDRLAHPLHAIREASEISHRLRGRSGRYRRP
mmetsp:Transcript_27120/g.63426  ORF Transcript_27120/g.63426 Transcript_27120/m.63426 type:complete len:254 (+) Transcript_27120:136-897(+)